MKRVMKSRHLTALSAALVGVPLMAVAVALPASSVGAEPPPIQREVLAGSEFPDDATVKFKVKTDGGRTRVAGPSDVSRVVVARVVVQPGAYFPLHTHPGLVVVNVVEGELTLVRPDCSKRIYPAGTAFAEGGEKDVHTAFGSSDGPTTLIATFLADTPFGDPLTIPETDPSPPSCP